MATDARANISIRRLTRDDAPIFHSFRLAMLAAAPTAFTSTPEEERDRSIESIEDQIAPRDRPNHFILGAFDAEGRLLGIAGLTVPARRQERHKGTLFGMGVAPEATGLGIGHALVTYLFQEARKIEGLLQIALTVTEGNARAEQLYRTFGFEVFGREIRAVLADGHPITKLHMVCMLD